MAADLTDHQTAEAMRDGALSSPQKYGEFWLFDMRITGTGMAFRDKIGEWAFRDPALWTSPEFVQRCNGLAVIFEHPEESNLNSEEFQERAIGQIILPYVKNDEVWGIAKIFDADAADLMTKTHRSTSPGVQAPKGAEAISLEGGAKVLDEGLPLILDHLAVCEAGVWDKDGPPEGIRLDSLIGKGEVVAEKTQEDLEKELADAKLRADSAEKERDDAKGKLDEIERADKARKDAAETEEAEKAEKERADAKKRDARKGRHDSEKHDGDILDCARCDAAEKGEHEGEGRADGAPVETINANAEAEIKDSKSRITQLEAQLAQVLEGQKPLNHDDAAAIAGTFHRADSVFQMLGEQTPRQYPGERPIAYRRRIATELRKFTKNYKTETIHDSMAGRAFDLLEDAIYAEALDEAKSPTHHDSVGVLREVVKTAHGKTRTEFFGDSRAAWEPFMAPALKISKINRRPDQG